MCEHRLQIEDVTQGDVVCGDCGLVLDKIYCFEPNISNFCSEKYLQIEKNINEQKINTKNKRDSSFVGNDLLITLVDKLHLNGNIRNSIFQLWKTIKQWYFEKKRNINLT